MSLLHEKWMQLALEQAHKAAELGEVPVGAVLVRDDSLIASAHNAPIAQHDASAHAEIQVLREAGRIEQNYRLPGTTLYVTIEPCTMCVGAMIHARVARLVFGSREPRSGAVCSQFHLLETQAYNHSIEFTEGIMAEQCQAVISEFFQRKRAQNKSAC